MKRKRLALLLAVAMTVTSLDSTAFAVSGADFSSEPVAEEEISVQSEEDTQLAAESEETSDISDGDEAEVNFSENDSPDEIDVLETPDETEESGEESSTEDIFGDGSEETEESTDETDAKIQSVSLKAFYDLSPTAGFDAVYSVYRLCEVTVTYADGSREFFNDGNTDYWSELTASNGEILSPVWKKDGEEITFESDDENEQYLSEGVYTLQYETGSEEAGNLISSEPVTVSAVAPEKGDRFNDTRLAEGDYNNIDQGSEEEIFKFVPSETGKWSFAYSDDDYRGMVVKKRNEDGSYTLVEVNGSVCELEAGETYYIVFHVYVWDLKIRNAGNTASVEVNFENAKTTFFNTIEYVYVSGAEITVTYEDGTSETVTFSDRAKLFDSRGNLYSYRFYKENTDDEYGKHEYTPGSCPDEKGLYKLYFTQNGQKLDGEYEITITDPDPSTMPELTEGLNKDISSPSGECAWYQFTPDKTTDYYFGPVNAMYVYETGNAGVNQVEYKREGLNNGSDYRVYALTEGITYYVGFFGNIYLDDDGNDTYTNVTDLEIKDASVKEITYTEDEVTRYIGVDNLDQSASLSEGELKVTHGDGSEESLTPYLGKAIRDSYGNKFCPQIVDSEGNEFNFLDEDEEDIPIPEGTYTLTFVLKDDNYDDEAVIKSNTITLVIQNATPDNFRELSIGTNEDVQVGYCDEYEENVKEMIWYRLQIEETGTYQIRLSSEDSEFYEDNVVTVWKKNEDGTLKDTTVDRETSDSYRLAAGSYVVGWYAEDAVYAASVTVDISKITGIKNVEIMSWAPESPELIVGIGNFSLDELKAKVTYDNDEEQEFTLDNRRDDAGRYLTYALYSLNDGEYERVYWMQEGTYYIRASFGGVFAEQAIPVNAKSMDNSKDAEISDETEVEVTNKEKLLLKYTAKATGRYEFAFNVPISDARIYTENADYPEDVSVDTYSYYANLEENSTYYLYVGADEYCEKLKVSVSMLTRPAKLRAKARKNNYIAGIDPLDIRDMETEITYSDKTSGTVRGRSYVNGYDIDYKVEKDGRTAADGNTLFAGTWTVTPYFRVSMGSGSAITADMSDVSVESTSITADFLDEEKLTALNEDEWTTFQNTAGNRKYYLFTPSENGAYKYELQDTTHKGYITFYNKGKEQYELLGTGSVNLEKGKTYLASVAAYGEVQMRIIRDTSVDPTDPDEPEVKTVNEIALTDGMKELVSIGTNETRRYDEDTYCIKGTFTPEEDGYYQIKTSTWKTEADTVVTLYDSEYEEIRYNDDGEGEDVNCILTSELTANKTYTYEIYMNIISESYDVPFFLHFNKIDKHTVSAVELVPKDGVNAEKLSLTDAVSAFYQLKVTYKKDETDESSITEVYDLKEDYGSLNDAYGNRFEFKYTEQENLLDDFACELTVTVGDSSYDLTAPVKGMNALPEFETGKDYKIPTDASQSYRFTPSEDGEYICTYTEENVQSAGVMICEPEHYMETLYTKDCSENPEGTHAFSVQLKKDKTYLLFVNGWNNGENDSFCIRKAAKELNGLSIVSKPDKTTCLPFESQFVSLKGLKVKASYKGGTTEEITYGDSDSSGRKISLEYVKWINSKTCRVFVTFGRYRTSFDMTAGTADELDSIQTAEKKTLSDMVIGDVVTLKYIPEETDLYTIKVDGGYVVYEILTEDAETPYSWSGCSYLEKGITYYIRVKAEASEVQLSIKKANEKCEWEVMERTEPTCGKDGKLVEKCKIHEDEELRETVLPATGEHTFEWVTDKEPTCGEEGSKHEVCKVCEATGKTEEIPATGEHTYKWVTDKEPTCGEAGTKHQECTVCHARGENGTIEATGKHTYEWVTDKEPTCGEAGSKHEICKVCKAAGETEEIPATGEHTYKWVTDKEPTCGEAGTKHEECTVCGAKGENGTIEATGKHTYEWVTDTEPTCGAKGTKHEECSVCHARGENGTIEATGKHTYEWVTDTEPTCVVEGTKHEECTVCHARGENGTIEATGKHTYEWVTDTEPTCGAEGKKHEECSVCHARGEEGTIDATGKHVMGDWKVTKAATVAAAGVKERTCTVCGGAKETAAIPRVKGPVTLNIAKNSTLPLKTKQSFQATATGLAKGDKVASWTSSNTKVATVSGSGKVTAQSKTGTAVITVTLASGTTAKFTVKVQKTDVATTAITVVNKATGKKVSGTVSLKAKKKLTLAATLAPLTSKQKVTYTSSNKKIATVSSKGVITAKKKGTVTITVKAGKKSVKIKVKVTK